MIYILAKRCGGYSPPAPASLNLTALIGTPSFSAKPLIRSVGGIQKAGACESRRTSILQGGNFTKQVMKSGEGASSEVSV